MCKLSYDIEYLERKEELLCKESIKIEKHFPGIHLHRAGGQLHQGLGRVHHQGCI